MKQPIRRKVWTYMRQGAYPYGYPTWGTKNLTNPVRKRFTRNKHSESRQYTRSCPLEAALFGVGYNEI